jgi:hypothetical protein
MVEENDIRQIGFILTEDSLNKLKQIKSFYRCRNQSEALRKLVLEEYERIKGNL